jgi:hypothetical protein
LLASESALDKMRPMHVRAQLTLLLLLVSIQLLARAQHIAAASQSTVTVSGAGIPGEAYHLGQMYGDWYATATDAHAFLTLRTLPGVHQATVGIAWDGKGLTQTIDAAKNDDIGGHVSFSLHLTGPGPYSQSAQPRNADVITVTITKMDNLTLEGTFSGTVTGTEPLKITGVISLHRTATAEQPTGTFGNCDPNIYDKLAGAESRSPSDCEVKFNDHVRKELTAALQPAINNLTAQSWIVEKQVEIQPLNSIPRHTEGKPFQLAEQEMHQGGAFYVQLNLDKNSPIFQQYDQPVQAAMAKFGDVLKSGTMAGAAAATDALHDATKAEQEHTSCTISVFINQPGVGISSFKGGHTVTVLPSGGFVVSAPFVQSPGGGDVSAAQQVNYLFLGAFTPPAVAGPGTGSESIQVKGSLNSANRMSVQNIEIRIQAGTAIAQQVISLLNWSTLRQLMAAK